jgi:hypothetical protein
MASRADWLYLAGLLALDTGAVFYTSADSIKYTDSIPLRISAPAVVGLTWGATLGGGYLALPKCSNHWVGEPPAEGEVRSSTPLALSLALVAAGTSPFVNAIAQGTNLPIEWSTFEREMHIVTGVVFGFAGALVPYLLPPRTWSAINELHRIRASGGAQGAQLTYTISF